MLNLLQIANALNYKDYLVGFSVAIYAIEQYLNFRQHRRYLLTHRPKEIEDIINASDFEKSQRYELDKSRFAFFYDFCNQIELVLLVHFDALPLMWDLSGRIIFTFGRYSEENEIIQSITFAGLSSLYAVFKSLPFSLYKTFVIEERHGFNKQSLYLFVADLIKSQFLIAVLLLPFLATILWIIKSAGNNFFIFVWGFVAIFQLFLITIYPTVIQPLFNKLTPLEEGSLKSNIKDLASKVNFPLKKLYVIDGSKRSSHSNAYFYGFGKNKHIVIYDTLIDHNDISNNDEICAVLAHELGHWKMKHTIKLLVLIQVNYLALFWSFSLFVYNRSLYEDFGFSTMPTFIGLILFMYISSPASSVIDFLMHMYQRKNEYEADAFASELGYGQKLRNALIKLSIKNLGGFNLDPWHSAWNRSHPSLIERLNALSPIVETKKGQ